MYRTAAATTSTASTSPPKILTGFRLPLCGRGYNVPVTNARRQYTLTRPQTGWAALVFRTGQPGVLAGLLFGKDETTEAERVEERLRYHNMKIKTKVVGDGNCQFRAIADLLYGDQNKYPRIRSDVVRWLEENKDYCVLIPSADNEEEQEVAQLADFLDTDAYPTWQDYCNKMSTDMVWGDHFTLKGAAEVYKANLQVLSSVASVAPREAVALIEPNSKDAEKTLCLLNWHDVHYDALEPEAATITRSPSLSSMFFMDEELSKEGAREGLDTSGESRLRTSPRATSVWKEQDPIEAGKTEKKKKEKGSKLREKDIDWEAMRSMLDMDRETERTRGQKTMWRFADATHVSNSGDHWL